MLQNTRKQPSRLSGGTAIDFKIHLRNKQIQITPHSMTFQAATTPQRPVFSVDKYGLQKDKVRDTSWDGRGIPTAYHSCTQRNTAGQHCINSTDHCEQLAKHACCEEVKQRYTAANMHVPANTHLGNFSTHTPTHTDTKACFAGQAERF